MIIGKYISSSISSAVRTIKLLCFGKDDVREANDCTPFGVDSQAPAGVRAIYIESTVNGQSTVVGYINKNAKAETGGIRLYSTDSNGTEKTYVYLRANGDIEIGGNSNHMTQYEALNNKLQEQITKINTQLDAIATGIAAAGGSYTPIHISEDFSEAKLTHVKTT